MIELQKGYQEMIKEKDSQIARLISVIEKLSEKIEQCRAFVAGYSYGVSVWICKTGRNAPNFKANLYSYTSYRPAYESAVNQKIR